MASLEGLNVFLGELDKGQQRLNEAVASANAAAQQDLSNKTSLLQMGLMQDQAGNLVKVEATENPLLQANIQSRAALDPNLQVGPGGSSLQIDPNSPAGFQFQNIQRKEDLEFQIRELDLQKRNTTDPLQVSDLQNKLDLQRSNLVAINQSIDLNGQLLDKRVRQSEAESRITETKAAQFQTQANFASDLFERIRNDPEFMNDSKSIRQATLMGLFSGQLNSGSAQTFIGVADGSLATERSLREKAAAADIASTRLDVQAKQAQIQEQDETRPARDISRKQELEKSDLQIELLERELDKDAGDGGRFDVNTQRELQNTLATIKTFIKKGEDGSAVDVNNIDEFNRTINSVISSSDSIDTVNAIIAVLSTVAQEVNDAAQGTFDDDEVREDKAKVIRSLVEVANSHRRLLETRQQSEKRK